MFIITVFNLFVNSFIIVIKLIKVIIPELFIKLIEHSKLIIEQEFRYLVLANSLLSKQVIVFKQVIMFTQVIILFVQVIIMQLYYLFYLLDVTVINLTKFILK